MTNKAIGRIASLYRSVRLFVNFFQPSFKLAKKSRDGAVPAAARGPGSPVRSATRPAGRGSPCSIGGRRTFVYRLLLVLVTILIGATQHD